MRSRALLAVSAIAVALAAVGCVSGNDSVGPPSGASSTTTTAPSRLAPPVKDPRNVGSTEPCDALNKEQREAFGFDQAGEIVNGSAAVGQSCTWRDGKRTQELSILLNGRNDMLEGAYRNKGTLKLFTPIEVIGLPAVLRQQSTSDVGCYLVVGLSEKQSMDVRYTRLGANKADPCERAKTIGAAVVERLPKGA